MCGANRGVEPCAPHSRQKRRRGPVPLAPPETPVLPSGSRRPGGCTCSGWAGGERPHARVPRTELGSQEPSPRAEAVEHGWPGLCPVARPGDAAPSPTARVHWARAVRRWLSTPSRFVARTRRVSEMRCQGRQFRAANRTAVGGSSDEGRHGREGPNPSPYRRCTSRKTFYLRGVNRTVVWRRLSHTCA